MMKLKVDCYQPRIEEVQNDITKMVWSFSISQLTLCLTAEQPALKLDS